MVPKVPKVPKTPKDRLARWMAEQAEAQRDVEARELLAKVRRRMFTRQQDAPMLGRYRDLERIGAGGMGIVYSALDPRLGRRVALKVVRLTTGAAQSDMQREARLLARTPHPNIVPVLDVGMDGDETFIAMELVEGQTFGDWIEAIQPDPGVAVAVLAEAGRGLAAAHEQGVVHLDFKPSNVLVGEDGRVRVTDFGLARELGGSRVITLDGLDDEALDQLVDGGGWTTRRGHGGTLGYAAPEQLDPRADVDGRADQFALGVCLFEALTGRLPWIADSPERFVAKVRGGPPPLGKPLPRRTTRTIERALRPDPERRFPSMAAMLEALGDGRTAGESRTRAKLLGLVLAPAIVLGAWVVGQPAEQRCPAADELAARWDDAQRGKVARAFLASGLPYADESFAAVDARLTDAVARWGTEYRTMCGADADHRDALGADAGLVCLDAQRGAIEAIVELLPRATATTVERSVDSVEALPDPARCRDVAPGVMPESDVDRTIAEALARRSAAARSLVNAGAYDEARARLGADVPGANEDVHAAQLAELSATRAEIAKGQGRHEEAEQAWTAAYHLAVTAGDDRLAALIAADLVELLGLELVRLEDADRWRRHAEVAVERWGDDDPEVARVELAIGVLAWTRGELEPAEQRLTAARDRLEHAEGYGSLRADVLLSLGTTLHAQGHFERSTPVLEEALTRIETLVGPEHPRLIGPLLDSSVNAMSIGDIESARRHAERALSLAIATLGPEHPRTAAIENNLGNVFTMLQDDAQARPHFERSLAIYRARLGQDHPQTVSPLVNLGSLHGRAGRHGQARAALEAALEVLRQAKGEDDVAVGRLYGNLGISAEQAGEMETARRYHAQGLSILEKRLGPDHVDVAMVRANLGMLALGRNDVETAVAELGRAREIRIAALGAEHPAVGYVGLSYGEALLAADEPGRARDVLEQALPIVEKAEPKSSTVARGELSLAEALRRGGDRDAARRLVERVTRRCEGDDAPLAYVCTAARDAL